MAKRLGALAALPQVPSSIPSDHMVTRNHCYEIWYPFLVYKDTCSQNTVYVINKFYIIYWPLLWLWVR